jgi:N-formylglutamate deformylase
LREALSQVLAAQQRYTHIVDGRFKGGHITRSYGRPDQGIHAVQLEMCWSTYMVEDDRFAWNDERAGEVRPLLRRLMQAMLAFRP